MSKNKGCCDPGGNRTRDHRLKRPLLYRLSYWVTYLRYQKQGEIKLIIRTPSGIRTLDRRIKSPLLYQLS